MNNHKRRDWYCKGTIGVTTADVSEGWHWPMRRKSNALNIDSATGLKTPENIPSVLLLSNWLAIATCGPWLQRLRASAGTFLTSIALRVRNNPIVSSWVESIVPYDRLLSTDDLSGTVFGLLPSMSGVRDDPYSRLLRDILQLYNSFDRNKKLIYATIASLMSCCCCCCCCSEEDSVPRRPRRADCCAFLPGTDWGILQ